MDTLNKFPLLGNVIFRFSEQLCAPTFTYDRRTTRLLIGLSDLLFDAENVLSNCTENIKDFQNHAGNGWKVHYIYQAGLNLNEFLSILKVLTKWVEGRRIELALLKVWTLDIRQTWDKLNDDDSGYSAGEIAIEYWTTTINQFREQLQATRSPDPKLFPTPETVVTIALCLTQLQQDFAAARSLIGEYALMHLTVSNFF